MTDTQKTEKSTVALVKAEILREISHPETLKSLLNTTFKGLTEELAKQALFEGMLRGFSFKEFLNRDVYAIPFKGGYSLITSIDRARKIGARSGIVGVDIPRFETDDDGKLVACSMTVKKRFADGYVGEFTAEVDFKEYSTGQNLWVSKPKTMIAKVAEMHALRKACPEELAQNYVEEEFEKGNQPPVRAEAIDITPFKQELERCKTLDALERVWADVPGDARTALKGTLDEMKAIIEANSKVTSEGEPVIE